MKTVTLTDFRRNFFKYMREVETTGKEIYVTKRGKLLLKVTPTK